MIFFFLDTTVISANNPLNKIACPSLDSMDNSIFQHIVWAVPRKPSKLIVNVETP